MTEPYTIEPVTRESAPEVPRLHPLRWVHENLFSSVASGLLTVVVGAGILLFLRGLLSFVFAPERQWAAISTNSRLMMTLAYPEEEYARVWVSFGIVASLTGLSLAAWRLTGRLAPARIARAFMTLGAAVAIVALLAPWSVGARVTGVLLGAGLAAAAWAVNRSMGVAAREASIPTTTLLASVLAAGVIALWILPVLVDRIVIASTTKVPLTVMALIGVAAYLTGLAISRVVHARHAQAGLVGLWLLSLPVIYLVVLRNPIFSDLDKGRYLVIAALFAVVGSALLWVFSDPRRREAASAVSALLVVVALAAWFPPLNRLTALIHVRLLLALLAAFAVGAPTFSGNETSRRIVSGVWAGAVVLLSYFMAVGEAQTGLDLQSDFLGGFVLTLLFAFAGILLSFPLGVLLALGRTSTMPIFRLLSTAYIETIRGVPLITMLFFGAFFLPLFLPAELRINNIVKAVLAITIFSAAYLAENVRGGLQSIPNGQYEAGRALGMGTPMLTLFIILPQALRAVIPALVGQVISLFKDTSLVSIIGLAEFLLVASKIVPNQADFIGSQREGLIFAAIVYWIFAFSFSRASLRLEKKLGVGER